MYQKLWCKNRVVVFLVNVFVIAVAVLVAWAPYCCVSTCKTVHSISEWLYRRQTGQWQIQATIGPISTSVSDNFNILSTWKIFGILITNWQKLKINNAIDWVECWISLTTFSSWSGSSSLANSKRERENDRKKEKQNSAGSRPWDKGWGAVIQTLR